MNQREFLDAILPEEGWYCAFAFDEAPDANSKATKTKFYDNKDQLLETLHQFDQNELATYVATSSFSDPESGRRQDNALYTQVLVIDLDVKEGEYSSKTEITQALKSFCIANELPKPILNESGGGYHGYWVFDEPVESARAKIVGDKFKKLCIEQGFNIDTNVTGDTARVMRMPGTRNWKLGKEQPRDCQTINKHPVKRVPFSKFGELTAGEGGVDTSSLDLAVLQKARELREQVNEQPSASMDRLVGNRETKFEQIIMKTKAGSGCAHIKHIVKNRESLDEPYWRAGLSIAVRCDDQELAVQAVASGHEDYDFEDSVEKGLRTTGPYTCEAFAGLDSTLCEGCPNAGKIKSPIQLGSVIAEATEEEREVTVETANSSVGEMKIKIPELPKGYVLGKNQAVYKVIDTGDDVEEVLVYENALWVDKRFKDPVDGEILIMKLVLPQDGLQVFSVKLETATSKEELRKSLSTQGIVARKWDNIMHYIGDWVRELQIREKADNARRQFGWSKDRLSFAMGEWEFTPDGIKPNYPTSATLAQYHAFESKGAIENWKKIPEYYKLEELYGRDVRFIRYALCASFGSIIMEHMDGVHSSIFHLNSNGSGKSKTAVMKAMASIWGDPENLVINGASTDNFIFNRAEMMKNIPLCIDEVTEIPEKQLSSFVMMSTQGKQKGRMRSNSNEERHRGDPWNMLSVSTSNNAITEKLSGGRHPKEAIAARVMEVTMKDVDFTAAGTEMSMEFDSTLADNYGLAGALFVQYLVDIGPEKIRAAAKKTKIYITNKLRLEQVHRNWAAQIACTVLACQIAKKLGILTYETEDILTIAGEIVEMNRSAMIESKREVDDIINEYVMENKGNLIIVDAAIDLRKGGAKNTGLEGWSPAALQDPNYRVVGRLEPDTENLYLMVSHLKQYCKDCGIVYRELEQELVEKYGAKIQRRRIDKGTDLKVGSVRVLSINQASWLKELADEPEAVPEDQP